MSAGDDYKEPVEMWYRCKRFVKKKIVRKLGNDRMYSQKKFIGSIS